MVQDALRHLLDNDKMFASWKNRDGMSICGFSEWRQDENLTFSARLKQLIDQPGALGDLLWPERDVKTLSYPELLTGIFSWVGHPIRLSNLEGMVYRLKGLKDIIHVSDDSEQDINISDWIPDAGPSPEQIAVRSELLRLVWEEILQLPPLQRIAYLLNFTVAEGDLELFLVYHVARIRDIGLAVALTEDHFKTLGKELNLSHDVLHLLSSLKTYDERFALLWPRLPLEDNVIAKMFNTQRQKVINLRKAAGDRLRRRLGGIQPVAD